MFPAPRPSAPELTRRETRQNYRRHDQGNVYTPLPTFFAILIFVFCFMVFVCARPAFFVCPRRVHQKSSPRYNIKQLPARRTVDSTARGHTRGDSSPMGSQDPSARTRRPSTLFPPVHDTKLALPSHAQPHPAPPKPRSPSRHHGVAGTLPARTPRSFPRPPRPRLPPPASRREGSKARLEAVLDCLRDGVAGT